MADNAGMVVDVNGSADIEIPADSDVLKAPVLPEVADLEKPEVKAAPEIVEDVDEPKPVEKAEKAAPKIDEAALTDAIRKQAELTAERDAARKEAEAERAARTEIEGRLRKAGDTATQAYWSKINADRDMIANSLAFLQTEMDRAEDQLQQAFEASDAKAVARMQREIAVLATKHRDLERGKEAAESHIAETKQRITEHYDALAEADKKPAKKAEPEPKPDQPQKPRTADDYIAALPSATGNWLKDNKDYVTDPAKHQQFIAFANYYGAKNGKLHTSDFVDALNKEFGIKSADQDVEDDVEEEAPKPEPKAAPKKTAVAAPPSRSGNVFSSRNMSGTKIKLPPHVADFVRSSGLDPQKYAEGLVADIKAGKLPKNYLDPDFQHEIV